MLSYEDFKKKVDVGEDYKDIGQFTTKLSWKEIANNSGIFVYPEIPKADGEEFKEMLTFAGNRKKDIKDLRNLPDDNVIHFDKHILFNHFYVYMYIRDKVLDNYMKKMVRDYVHFRKDIFDIAQSYIQKLPTDYYAIHLRRGDFLKQYPNQNISPKQLLANIEKLIPEDATIYIATDEKETFMEEHFIPVLSEKWDILTMHDISPSGDIGSYPENWVGVVEQVICSRATKFVGTKLSTFSGFITRMRGYMRDINDKGIYFTDTPYPDKYDDAKMFSVTYPTWSAYWDYYGIWGREFSESWILD